MPAGLLAAGCNMLPGRQVTQTVSVQEGGSNMSCEGGSEADLVIFATLEEIKEIQARLILLGYTAGRVDGILGENTENAIRAYQAAHKLLTDGRPSPELLAHIKQTAGNTVVSEDVGADAGR
jgi:hypothetical protein